MKKEQYEIIEKFKEIANEGWMKGINNTTNSVGLTFESLIGKNPDSMYFPDYNGLEIKCSQRYSKYPIKLFSLSFDGPNLYEMNRLLELYGKEDVIYKERKQLQGQIKTNEHKRINDNYFILKIDKKKKKLLIGIYDLNKQLTEEKTYIKFETIKSRLNIKLSNLAMIYASKKIIDNNLYFRYYLIKIYKLKSFETFLNLLENNYIKVEIIGRVSRSGLEKGRQRNKNLVFSLPKEYIDLLFKKQIEYNNDINKV